MAYYISNGNYHNRKDRGEVFNEYSGRLTEKIERNTTSLIRSAPQLAQFGGKHNQIPSRLQVSATSGSKLKAEWAPHVGERGDLFYVDVGDKTSANYAFKQKDKFERQVVTKLDRCLQNDKNVVDSRKIIPYNGDFYRDESIYDINDREGTVDCEYVELKYSRASQNSIGGESLDSGFRISRGSSTSSSSSYSERTSGKNLSHGNSCPVENVKSGNRKTFSFLPDFSGVHKHDISGITLCEKLFGIVLCEYKHKPPRHDSRNSDQALKDRKVIVRGVIPDSEAQRCGKIYRGDMLVNINDLEVSWLNLDEIFQTISKRKVKLTFQEPVLISPNQLTPPRTPVLMSPNHPAFPTPPPTPPRPRKCPAGENLVDLVSNGKKQEVKRLLEKSLCTVMYITMEDDITTNSGKSDVYYQFPISDNKLTEIRGLFPTISGVLPEITNNKPKISSLSIEGNLVHIGYWNFEKDVLVIGLPANRVDVHILTSLLSNLLRLVEVLFSSISGAFRCPENKERLDQLFTLTFHRLLQKNESSIYDTVLHRAEQLLLDTVTGIRWLRLSEDNKLLCDEILSEFEAADFDYLNEDVPYCRRKYSILGTCLYYKEYLICSHLPVEDERDVHLFLLYHSVLSLVNKQSLDELVIWREIYPTRRCHCPEQFVLGFTEPDGKWFILVVGMKHFLMVLILESGGCAKQMKGTPGPDPFFVDQAKATLLQLETEDVEMAHICEQRLMSEGEGLCLASADILQNGHKSGREDSFTMSPLRPLGSPRSASTPAKTQSEGIFKWRSNPQMDKKSASTEDYEDRRSIATDSSTPVMRRQGSKMSYGSNDSGGSGGSLGMHKVNKSSNKGSVSALDLSSVGKNISIGEELKQVKSLKLTKGQRNLLFHYLCVDQQKGIFVAPTSTEVNLVRGAVHELLLENFHKSCLLIHKSFKPAKDAKLETQIENSKSRSNEKSSVFGGAKALRPISEQGTLFCCRDASQDSKQNQHQLQYWVIGRLFPDGRELYICVHDSVPQNIVEMAFSLQFGL